MGAPGDTMNRVAGKRDIATTIAAVVHAESRRGIFEHFGNVFDVVLQPAHTNGTPIRNDIGAVLIRALELAVNVNLPQRQDCVLGCASWHAAGLDDRRDGVDSCIYQVGNKQAPVKTRFRLAGHYVVKSALISVLRPTAIARDISTAVPDFGRVLPNSRWNREMEPTMVRSQ